jgi:hypothetical protein
MTTNSFDYADKIAKLLKMAEGAPNEEMAANYMAKASELQLQHMIADSDIRQAEKGPQDNLARHFVRGLDKNAGYIKAKRDIVYGLAVIFHCKVTIAKDRSSVALYGFQSDIDFIQTLSDSLQIQMMRHMETAAHTMPRYESARTWRTSFAHGFADRVVARLRASRASQEAEAGTNTPGTALVLRDRSQAVAAYFDDIFAGKKLGASYKNRSIRSANGLIAGDAAGSLADLGGKAVRNTSRRAID